MYIYQHFIVLSLKGCDLSLLIECLQMVVKLHKISFLIFFYKNSCNKTTFIYNAFIDSEMMFESIVLPGWKRDSKDPSNKLFASMDMRISSSKEPSPNALLELF